MPSRPLPPRIVSLPSLAEQPRADVDARPDRNAVVPGAGKHVDLGDLGARETRDDAVVAHADAPVRLNADDDFVRAGRALHDQDRPATVLPDAGGHELTLFQCLKHD
jgi:hypothetical protein